MTHPVLIGRTVLLLTDDAGAARALGGALRDASAVVRLASSTDAALGILISESIDALVCDLASRFDGYAWMRKVRGLRDPEKRVVVAIAVSGDSSLLHLSPFRAASAGFDVHLLTRDPHDTVVDYVRRLTEPDPRRSSPPPPRRVL